MSGALDVIASTDLDGAILDLNLNNKVSFAVADALAHRHVQFIFSTGLEIEIPVRHASVVRLETPAAARVVCRALEAAMASPQS